MNWRNVKLIEVCSVKTGRKDVNESNSNGQYPFFTCAKEHTYSDVYSFDCEAILIAGNGAVGQTSYYNGKFEAYQRTYVLSEFKGIIPKFLLLILKGKLMKYLSSKVLGNTIPYIKKNMLESFEFSIPPLEEQKHVLSRLITKFTEIDKTKNILKKNITNIDNIYDSFLASVYEECKSSADYNEKFLGDIIKTLTDYHANGSYQTLKKHVKLKNEKDFAYMVRSTDFEKKFTNSKRYISKSAYEFLDKSKVFGGEIIMSKIGNAGKVYLMPKISYPCSLAMNLFLIRLDESLCSNEFIFNFLKSKYGKIQISQRVRGATTQTINKDNVRSIKVPLIKKELQKKIVYKINMMKENVTKIKKNYSKKLNLLIKLKETLIVDLKNNL